MVFSAQSGSCAPRACPGTQEFDLRFGWQAHESLDVSIVGRELLHDRHAEFLGASTQARYFQREVAVRVTWQSR